MTESTDPPVPESPDATPAAHGRILVALDSSNHSLAALKAAAELAALMQAELQGLFVEDIDLIRLSSLPFTYEIGSYSARRRRLDSGAVERDFRLMAQQMRRAVAQTAVTARVRWSFQVTRGSVTNELLAAAEAAEMLTLGRIGRTPGRRLGSTARMIMRRAMRPVFLLSERGLVFPLVVLHTGSPAAERAVELAAAIMHGRKSTLQLWVLVDPEHDETERDHRAERLAATLAAAEIDVEVRLLPRSVVVEDQLQELSAATLILPLELAELLERLSLSTILVP